MEMHVEFQYLVVLPQGGHKLVDVFEGGWSPASFFPPTPSISSIQSLSHVQLFVTPWTAAHQASLSITNSWSLLKLMSI